MKDNIFPLRVYTFINARREHYGYEVVNSPEELAQKIVANERDKLVTDFMDLPVFDTFGSFVAFVYDNTEQYGDDAPNYKPWFFEEFQPILLKAQGFKDHHPCGDCAYYGYCYNNPLECDCADFTTEDAKARLKHLYNLYQIEPNDLTQDELDELVSIGLVCMEGGE